MIFPVTNARLTLVAGGGFTEDYGLPEGADTTRWTGDVGAYVTDRVLEQVNGNSADQVRVTRLTIPANLGLEVNTGDSVTWSQYGTVRTRRVRNIEDHTVTGTIRLNLWDQ